MESETRLLPIAIVCVFATTAMLLLTSAAHSTDKVPALKCESLAGATFPGTTIAIGKAVAVPEAPPGTVAIRPKEPAKVSVKLPPHCRVTGLIDKRVGGDGRPYHIGFEIALPDRWNGRLVFQGGGGLNGEIRPALGPQATGVTPALARGFAVVSTDSGHQGGSFDASFLKEQEATINFSYAAVGKVTATAKTILARYYSQPPARSYFVGCSTGGREGMLAAQRYPGEFDGIVAGAPAMRTGRSNLGLAWANHNFTRAAPKDASGKREPDKAFSAADRKLITQSIIAVCDKKDGIEDGMIFNTRQCQFDPATLVCKGPKTDACLTADQASALASAVAGPKNSRGAQVYPAFPWDTGLAADQGYRIPSIVASGAKSRMGPAGFETLDVDKIEDEVNASAYDRLRDTQQWSNLNSYFARGGKILFYHGVSDPWFSANDTTDYYERMANSSGGMDKVRANSSRAFLVPGMGHCSSGTTLDEFDLLQAVVDWVEQGKAPDRVVATGPAFPGRSRPLCAHPQYAVYKGQGNPEEASSFDCRQ